MSGPKHSCGVIGIVATHNIVPALQKTLMIIQHRGQESAGITIFDGNEFKFHKENGLVQDALRNSKIEKLNGNIGIGHVRYSTTGSKDVINAQPLIGKVRDGIEIAIAHNGDITNCEELKRKRTSEGGTFHSDSDSEVIMSIFAKHFQKNDIIHSLKHTASELDGSYALAILIDNRLFGVRDPYGLRPLCIGKLNDGFILASESTAIDALGGEFVRDVEPGEIVEVTKNKVIPYPNHNRRDRAYCMFEWVYFARPDSVLDEREVYDVRKRIGEILAKEHPADVDSIMPIPDSGRAHAIGFSIASGIPYEEGFMKNRFAERTFILPDQSEREKAVSSKMNPIKSTVNGKRIVIVDDSIVRGTTLIRLIAMLRKAGAREVHVRVGSPPVIAPCYYGVDMKSRDQFIANNNSIEDIRRIIDADSLGYISIEGLIEAIGKPKSDLCLGCVNAKYPTRIPKEVHRSQSTLID